MFALVIRHENLIFSASHYIVIRGLLSFAIFLSRISHKWQDFRGEEVTEHKMCILSPKFVKKISHS